MATVAVSAALVTTLTLMGGAGSAQAAPASTSGDASVSTVAAGVSTAQRSGLQVADQASSYWTPERLRTAQSADTLVDKAQTSSGTASRAAGTAQSTPPAAPSASVATRSRAAAAGPINIQVNASATVGKVFFYNPADGKNYVCSAGTVNSGSKLLVMSAGHCVHGGRGGQWMQNWIFIPYYNYGAEPYGRWSAKYLTTFNAWINDSNLDRDVSYITMWPNASGQRPVDVLGGNGLSVNYSYEQAVTILAYPAAPPYDGGWQQYCQGTTYRPGIWPFQENQIALRCGFTGGSSGSVWLRLYNGSYGYVNGIMSTLDSSGVNRSPYFDTAVMDAYNSVANRT
ncbi:trypsin-like serine peptidase [Micromonospora zhanjiangensis]|uniref:V8-like Glu-specific endopeptidase n=1 Tax=Micromonospora zhanjiangensis TaxID=1522057 RepID=A0ABV8KPC9_9ACTN